MEVNEKNIQNPDFDSNLTGICGARNFPQRQNFWLHIAAS